MLKAKQHGPNNSALLRWLKTFVIHFLAKRTLEQRDFGFPTEEVAFSIIAVDHSPVGVKTSWSVMKDIISETMADQEPQAVILQLEARIRGTLPHPNAKIVEALQWAILQENTFVISARLHCEIVLATLGLKECRGTAFTVGDGPLKELFEVQWCTLLPLID